MFKAVGTALIVALALPLVVAGSVALTLMAIAGPALPVLTTLALFGNVPWSWVLWDLLALGASGFFYALAALFND